jgi:DNA-binding transcriptional MerR regulator
MPRTITTHVPTADAVQIGVIAARTGVTVETLRYYEKRGLVRPIARRGSGYREYGADSVRVVLFIKRAQALGFSLTEVEELVRLRERAWAGDAPRVLRDAAVSKVEDIDHRIRQLSALRDALAELVSACDAACPVEPQGSNCECEPSPGAVGALPCPLIEALDPVHDGSIAVKVEPTPTSATRNTNSEPVTRRPKARRTSLARKPSPIQRRNP